MDQRNVVMAMVLSAAIIIGWYVLFPPPPTPERDTAQQQKEETLERHGATPKGLAPSEGRKGDSGLPPVPGAGQAAAPGPSREALIAKTPRIRIVSDRVRGSISTTGARIDDLVLTDYRETIDPNSPQITLLSPAGTPGGFYADFGWWADKAQDVALPGTGTNWTADRPRLAPNQPVTLSWTDDSGLRFSKVISIDHNFMFTVTQRVHNGGSRPVTLHPYGQVSRIGTKAHGGTKAPFKGAYIHIGPVAVLDGTLREKDYEDLRDKGENITSTGGWIGIKEQYWLVALVPDQKAKIKASFLYDGKVGPDDRYRVGFIEENGLTVQPGQTVEVTGRLFAGAKEASLLERYQDEIGVPDLIMAIDYTWIFFLTIPLHKVLRFFYGLIGNYGLAIMLLTVIIKVLFFPLANKSYKSMSRMKKLQPKLVEIRERYKDDRQRQQQEMMALYKRENANPASGCLPILIQIPVFISLYIVLFVTIEMRHAPFYGWIHDLSAPDPLGLLTAFGLIQWHVPEMLHIVNIGIWPLIMGATMFLQQRLNPQPADPMQAKIFMLLPIVFTFLLGRFPAGLVIYWAWNNTLSICQQWIIMRRMGVSASGQTTSTTPPKAPPRPGRSKAKTGGNAKAASGGNSGAAAPSGENEPSAPAASAGRSRRRGSGKRRRSSKPSKGAV